MMRYWVGVSSAFGIGGSLGFALAVIMTEEKFRKEYQESTASMRRAMELAREPRVPVAPPVAEEVDLDIDFNKVAVHVADPYDSASQLYKPANKNPYHIATESTQTSTEMFVDGGVNDYGVSYIEEEEYHEDDGRVKAQITILMDDRSAIFLEDGAEIRDWDTKIGDSILVDFYAHVPPNLPQVLYVRNHKTDVDYEVSKEQP